MSEPLVFERMRAHDSAWKGPGHNCRCPGPSHANGDRNPSLSVDIGHDGRALLRCFAGCAVDDIVRALGCKSSDLFVSGSRTPIKPSKRTVTSETLYEVRDVDGTVRAVHVRVDYSDGSKAYRWTDPLGTRHSGTLEVDRLPLFASERVRDFPSDSVRYVCEGEKSASALLDVGTLALGTVGGASKCPSADALAVLHGTDVVLWPDNDAPGRKHMAAIAAALEGKAKSIRFARWDEAPPKGDAADFVAKLRDAGLDDVAIRQRVASLIVDQPSTTPATQGLALTTLDKIAAEPIAWLWTGRVPLRKITLIVGDPGLGKSMLTHELAARVTVGDRIADDRTSSPVRGEVLLFSAEDGLSDTVRPRIEATRGDVSKVHVLNPRPEGEDGPSWLTLDADLNKLDAALTERPNVRLVSFDPLNAYVGKADAHKDHEIRGILAKLGQIAERHDVAIVLVAHLNKGDTDAIYRVGGSIGIVAVARMVWLVVKDPHDETRRMLLPLKSNLGGKATGLAWRIHADSQDRPVVIWSIEPLTESAADVLRAQRSGTTQPKRNDALSFIETKLADGPVPSAALLSEAEAAGFSRSTCFRARDDLKIRSRKIGGAWFWVLPGTGDPSKSSNGRGVEDGTLGLDLARGKDDALDASACEGLPSDATSTEFWP